MLRCSRLKLLWFWPTEKHSLTTKVWPEQVCSALPAFPALAFPSVHSPAAAERSSCPAGEGTDLVLCSAGFCWSSFNHPARLFQLLGVDFLLPKISCSFLLFWAHRGDSRLLRLLLSYLRLAADAEGDLDKQNGIICPNLSTHPSAIAQNELHLNAPSMTT